MLKRITAHLSYANIAATLALVLALSGGALAATGALSNAGTLQACVNKEGVLRLLKAGKKCKKGQSKVSWNQTGPPGPKGAAGAPGTPGAAGPPGSPGAGSATLWAEFNGEGLAAGSGVTNVAGDSQARVFTFNRDISKCAVSGNLSEGPAAIIYVERGEFPNQLVVVTGFEKAEKFTPAFGGIDLVVTC